MRDTGVGIPQKNYRGCSTGFIVCRTPAAARTRAWVIGLSLVQELVRLHGGFIRVESTLGKGSTFIVSIPFGQNHLSSNRLGGKSHAEFHGNWSQAFCGGSAALASGDVG